MRETNTLLLNILPYIIIQSIIKRPIRTSSSCLQDYDRELSRLMQDDLENVANYEDHMQ